MATSLGKIPEGTVGAWIQVIFKNQAGAIVNISSATTKTIRFLPPANADDVATEDVHGTITDKAGSFTTDGTDGKLRWLTTTGFLTPRGTWKVMGLVIIGADTFPSYIIEMDVLEVIAAP